MQKYLAAIAVAVLGLGLTACGSSSKKTSAKTPASTPSMATTTSTKAKASTPASSGSSTGGSVNMAAYNAAKQGCEAGIKSNAAIEASKQSMLSKECQKLAGAAGSGVLSKYKAEYGVFCNDLASALPAAAVAVAKASCKQQEAALKIG